MELCNKIYNEDHYINIISIKFNGPAILLIFIVPCNWFVLLGIWDAVYLNYFQISLLISVWSTNNSCCFCVNLKFGKNICPVYLFIYENLFQQIIITFSNEIAYVPVTACAVEFAIVNGLYTLMQISCFSVDKI